jgi:hypothetical protein
MRPERGGAGGGRRGEPQHHFCLAGCVGVVREAGEIRLARRWRGEGSNRLPVQRDLTIWRERLVDGKTGEFVPERHRSQRGDEHAGRQAFVEAIDCFSSEGLEEPQFDPRRRGGHRLEQGSRHGAKSSGAGENGVLNRLRDPRLARGECLGDEERIARGLPVELGCVDAVRLCHLRHSRRREGLDLQAADRASRRELPEHEPEWVGAIEFVVPVARDDECGDGLDSATEHRKDIERRLVGPVEVVQHEHRRRPLPEFTHECGRELVRPGTRSQKLLELPARDLGDVEEGAERTRREQSVAVTPQDPCRAGRLVAELPQESGLPNSRLAADEHEPPTPGVVHGNERVVERSELARPLE